MPSNHRSRLAVLLTTSAAIAAGCSDPNGLAPVEGVVVMDGEPVRDAAVMFIPQKGGRPAWALTDEAGEFKLTTYKKQDGALIGPHRVAVTKVVEESVGGPKRFASDADEISSELIGRRRTREVWVVPQRYSDANNSGIEFTVESGSDNRAVLELTTS